MHKAPTALLSWEVILCLQSDPSRENISSSSHRPQLHSITYTPSSEAMYRCIPRPRLVVGLPPHLEWNIRHPGDKLVNVFIHVSVHRCIQHPRLGGGQETGFKPSGYLTKWTGTSFEAVCCSLCCEHLGLPVATKKGLGSL